MVAGHSGTPFTKFIYLFHMAIFFMASGFFYKSKLSDSINGVIVSIIKKFKQLWFPFFIWNTIFTLFNNIFIRINIYTDNPKLLNYIQGPYIRTHEYMNWKDMLVNIVKGAFFGGATQMGGAFWFLRILFMVSVCFCVGDFLVKKIFKKHTLVIQLIASVLLLAFGFVCSIYEESFYGFA